MTDVTTTEAKKDLGALLKRVQSGEGITITRHGKPVANLVPANRAAPSMSEFRAMHGQLEGSALAELLSMRAEGR